MEILNEDNYGIKYANIIDIINSIGIYLDKHPEKEKFSPYTFAITKTLKANDILKKDLNQMIIIAEFIILLTSIGKNKITYLERITDSDEKIFNIYFNCIEKYMLIESDEITQSKNIIIEKANNKQIVDKDKKALIQLVKDQDHKLNEYMQQIKNLQSENTNLVNNLKEKELLIEKNKSTTKEEQKELINNNIIINKIKNENKEKDITIDSLKSQLDYIQKKEKEKIYKLEDEIITLKNNLRSLNEIKEKYEQLLTKYKNLKMKYDDKGKEKDDALANKIKLMNDIEEVKEKNEYLIKVNDLLKNEINKINENSLIDKEKIKQYEIENIKLNYEINELNEKIIKNKKIQKKEENNFKGITLDKILEEDENDIEKTKTKFENIKFENENLKIKITSLNQEKQKLILDLQKTELDNQKLSLTIDRMKNESKRLTDDNKCLNEKIIEINKLKKRDIDKLKKEIEDKSKMIEKMLQEKKDMIKKYEKLQKDVVNLKYNNSGGSINKKNIGNRDNIIKEKEIIISNSENLELKNEIQNLNILLLQKDEEIRKLKEERQLSDDEVNLKLADLDFYKKLYEEQKYRVNKEHELISESLYKLAVHFMSLKDDLQKKIKNK